MKGLLALSFGLAVFMSDASAEIIQRLAGGAACRSEEGVVYQSRIAPKLGVAAHRAANGMIATDQPVDKTPCYLYRSEVKLGDATPCPSAGVGGPGGTVGGTLGVPNCANE